MIKKTVFYLILYVFIIIRGGFTKDCPSRLFANLHQFKNSNIFWGVELKAFLYNYQKNYYFGGISAAIDYEGETSVIQFEGVLKKKKYTPCDNLPDLSPFQIRRLNMEKYINDSFSFTIGRQEISIATGLILDDFFDGISFKIGERNYFSGGGGIYSIYVAKEAIGCQKCFFYNYRPCWKNLSDTEWGDIKMGFINYTFRIKKNEYGIIYVRGETKDESMRTNIIGLYFRISLPGKIQIFSEFATQHFDSENKIAFGFNTNIMKRIKLAAVGTLHFKLRYLFGSTNENAMFTPLFGTTYLGERQHFTVRQGNIFGGELKLNPSFYKRSSLKFSYFTNSQNGPFNFISDEFDTTLEVNIDKNERFKLLTTYAVWSGVYNGSQLSLNLRIIL